MLATALLSGCAVSLDPEHSPSPATGLTLASLARCAWTYPDGTPLDCARLVDNLTVRTEPLGPRWVCFESFELDSGWGLEVYREPVQEEYAVRYYGPQDSSSLSGLVEVGRAEGRDVGLGSDLPREGFIELGSRPNDAMLHVRLLTARVAASSLSEPRAVVVWTWFKGTSFPLYRVEAREGTLFVSVALGGSLFGGPEDFALPSAELTGTDFHLALASTRVLDVGIPLQHLPSSPANCPATGLLRMGPASPLASW